MFNKRTLAIIKRELREKLLSKSFLLMTFLIPVFMFGILGLQTFLMSFGGDDNTRVQIIAADEALTSHLQSEFSKLDIIKSKFYYVDCKTISKEKFPDYLKSIKNEIISEKISGVFFIPQSALKDKKIEYYSKTPNNYTIFQKIRGAINKALVGIYFENKEINSADISFASEGVDFNGFRISKEEKIEEEGYGNLVISFLFTFLLYFSLIFTGTIMMRSVIQEKTNRIVEILLSSVNSQELMTGKILGTAITGVLQMAIWLLPLIMLITTSWFVLPKEFVLKINMLQVIYFLVNYFVGIITFMGLFAAVGAIFDNDQDAQSGIWPIMMLIMIPFFIAITMQNNPANPIARISSMIPFASIIVMPARMTLVDVPVWQFLLSIIVNIATMLFIFVLSGKIYRIGVLMTGKKPKWSEVAQWIRLKA